MSAQTEQRIRKILEKYIGPAAYNADPDEDFMKRFPNVTRYGSPEIRAFCKDISDAFNVPFANGEWEDVVSINDLADILETGKLSEPRRKAHLAWDAAASVRTIKVASALFLPLAALLVVLGKEGAALMTLVGYLAMVGLNYARFRNAKKDLPDL